MTNLQPYSSSGYLAPRDARRTARTLSQFQAKGRLREAAIDIETGLAITKSESYTFATVSGMQDVVRVAKAQEALEQLSPAASARLNYLAESHLLGVSSLLNGFEQTLRRI